MIKDARIRVIIGHYGSGKTEFSVNYAIALAKMTDRKIALADLDIVNPYFRSRERHSEMEAYGVTVLSSQMGNDVNFDLPSVDAGVLGPLQNEAYEVIMDVGGDPVGARALARYREYLVTGAYDMLAVVNCSRPDSQSVEGIIIQVKAIESAAGVKLTGLINNTHFLRETTLEDVLSGQKLIEEAAAKLMIPIRYVSVIRALASEVSKHVSQEVLPVDMYMRDVWM